MARPLRGVRTRVLVAIEVRQAVLDHGGESPAEALGLLAHGLDLGESCPPPLEVGGLLYEAANPIE